MRPSGVDSGPDSGFILKAVSQAPSSRWQAWRTRILVALALLGSLALVQVARELAAWPQLPGAWVLAADGGLELRRARTSGLEPHVGKRLIALAAGDASVDLHDATLLRRSPRWVVDDADRAKQAALHRQLSRVLAAGDVTLTFDDGQTLVESARPPDIGALPASFWLLGSCALALYLLGVVMVLVRSSSTHLLFFVMVVCQVGNLGLSAVEAALGLGLPSGVLAIDFGLRAAFDLVTLAAAIHVVSIGPPSSASATRWIATGWISAGLGLVSTTLLTHAWWWLQVASTLLLMLASSRLQASARRTPRVAIIAVHRLSLLALVWWLLLTMGLGLTSGDSRLHVNLAVVGSASWSLLLAALLAITPLLSRRPQVRREFGLFVAVSTFAVLLDLLLVDVVLLNRWLAAAVSLTSALGVYTAFRQWLLSQLLGVSAITTERMFERLYRIARDVESNPQRTPKLLAELLTELFDPVHIQIIQEPASRTRVTGDGSTMLVPVPAVAADGPGYDGAVVLRFAQRGNRSFTSEDIRLADRIVEQLERAVAYDRAVEHGRTEERQRIAQDLHDDIGARLLTLIYKAQTPEMEDYARHTLQDLKTLTRGLAATSHRLSHAAGDWKADLTHRLSAASVDLAWSCEFDEDLLLSMVQWSALTRVLRELVTNAIAHSAASRVEISVKLQGDCIHIVVYDDGLGRNPTAWAHGLGLAGVRKRVKQLGGNVEWVEAEPSGICCRVTVQNLSRQSRTS